MVQRKKVGILGGTFNPIHNGHLILAQSAIEALELAQVLFIPCLTPPHKVPTGLIAPSHRVGMVHSAIENDLRFELNKTEIERDGVSYAVDTVSALREEFPNTEFFFIIGADTLKELYLWRNIYNLLEMCTFVTFSRPPLKMDTIKPEDLNLDPPWCETLLKNIVVGRQIDISSSEIRYRIAEGMSIRYLVPPSVEMYIAEHRLY
ncbi:MAG: nicotinate-nucleotide adenylyltransferase [Kiritimatiellae bacterium]|nr:nicotinate-nucleotide adenylyltransferase [Kiritimatiellia bacterium]